MGENGGGTEHITPKKAGREGGNKHLKKEWERGGGAVKSSFLSNGLHSSPLGHPESSIQAHLNSPIWEDPLTLCGKAIWLLLILILNMPAW